MEKKKETDKEKSSIGRQILARKPLLATLVATFVAAVYIYLIMYVPAVNNARLQFDDNLFRLRHLYYSKTAPEKLRPKDIVLVSIDEDSYYRMKRRWPWTRDVFAEFITKLAQYKPKTIALDFALYGQTTGDPEKDVKLAESMKEAGNVIVASAYGKDRLYLGPHKLFRDAAAGNGIIGAVVDPDDRLRKTKTFTLILSKLKSADISFEIKTAANYLDISGSNIERFAERIIMRRGAKKIIIPTDKNRCLRINYLSQDDDIISMPIWRVMNDTVGENIFKNKLVLVSQTGRIFHDYHPTPLGLKSGAVILTNILNSIIHEAFIKDISPILSFIVMAALFILCGILFYRVSFFNGLISLIVISSTYFYFTFYMFLKGVIWPTFYVVSLLPALFLCMVLFKYATMFIEGVEIKRMAITDSLTRLYTHRYFRFLMEHMVDNAVNFKQHCSVILIKMLNLDSIVKDISFNKGQLVQKKIADILQSKLPQKGYASYLGMGELCMLLPKTNVNTALGIAGSLRDRIKEEDYDIEEQRLIPTVAMGVSEVNFSDFPQTGNDLMKSVKVAMYRSKDVGYNKICRFNPKIDSAVFEPTYMENEIKQRLDNEFSFLASDLEERNRELEDLLRQLSMTQRDLEQAHFETLKSLVVALEEKDPCTAGHSERVGKFAEMIGRRFKMPEEKLRLMRQAGHLHDIGKVGIPQDILRKDRGLTSAERHVIELHPEFSVKILNSSKYFNSILHAIRDHHERLDGSGYPRGLKGNQISIEAQIIMICDVFDAMTTDRPYRKALSPDESLNEMFSQPEKYNRNIVIALKHIIEVEIKKEKGLK